MSASAIVSSIGVGICKGHIPPIPMTGVVITGAGSKQIENNDAAIVSSIVMGHCGHFGTIISGAGDVEVEGQDQAVVGSPFTGIFSGVITTGAATHETD